MAHQPHTRSESVECGMNEEEPPQQDHVQYKFPPVYHKVITELIPEDDEYGLDEDCVPAQGSSRQRSSSYSEGIATSNDSGGASKPWFNEQRVKLGLDPVDSPSHNEGISNEQIMFHLLDRAAIDDEQHVTTRAIFSTLKRMEKASTPSKSSHCYKSNK